MFCQPLGHHHHQLLLLLSMTVTFCPEWQAGAAAWHDQGRQNWSSVPLTPSPLLLLLLLLSLLVTLCPSCQQPTSHAKEWHVLVLCWCCLHQSQLEDVEEHHVKPERPKHLHSTAQHNTASTTAALNSFALQMAYLAVSHFITPMQTAYLTKCLLAEIIAIPAPAHPVAVECVLQVCPACGQVTTQLRAACKGPVDAEHTCKHSTHGTAGHDLHK